MSFWYQVILKPSDVKFTHNQVSSKLKNGCLLQTLLDDLLEGRKLVKEVPLLDVVWFVEKWEWYALNNGLLWVFKELEKAGKITYIEMRRIEFMGKINEHPKRLYEVVEILEKEMKESFIDRTHAVKSGKKTKDVKLLSKSLRRFHLCQGKGSGVTVSGMVEEPKVVRGSTDQLEENTKVDCNGNMVGRDPREVSQEIDEKHSEFLEGGDNGLDIVSCQSHILEPLEEGTGNATSLTSGMAANESLGSKNTASIWPGDETKPSTLEIAEKEGADDESPAFIELAIRPESSPLGGLESKSKVTAPIWCERETKIPALDISTQEEADTQCTAAVEFQIESEFVLKKEPAKGPEDIAPIWPSKESEILDPTVEMGIEEDANDEVKDVPIAEDAISLSHSRSPSVCSSVTDGRGVDDWGRKDRKHLQGVGNEGQSSEDDWVEIESVEENTPDEDVVDEHAPNKSGEIDDDNVFAHSNAKEKVNEAIQAWLNDRKKFCRDSKNSHFHEYVVDNINPKKPKPSLSQSLLSLDSAFSSASVLSSISRDQRQISPFSGFFGYGNFDKYNTEYLSKLRAERLATKRRLKPYDVTNSRRARVQSSAISWDGNENRRNVELRSASRTVVYAEEKVTRRTYSETFIHNGRKTHKYEDFPSRTGDVSWYSQDTESYTRRRGYSESDYRQQDVGKKSFSFPARVAGRRRSDSFHTSRPYKASASISQSRCSSTSLAAVLKTRSVSKKSLYELWQKRRDDYMKARYNNTLSLVPHKSQKSLVLTGYTCGLCFKSFKTRTRREQHSDELMHWACITCGKFFASHTALGQHVEEVGHRKD